MAKFKQDVLDMMKTDTDLFAALAKALGIKPTSLPQTIDRNGASLNQYSIVTLVAEYLGKEPQELLESSEDTEKGSETEAAKIGS